MSASIRTERIEPRGATTPRSRCGTRHCSPVRLSGTAITLLLLFSQSGYGVGFQVAGERGAFWEASFYLNYLQGEDLDFGAGSAAEIDSDLGWGVGIHYNFDNHWNIGLDMSFNRPDYRTELVDQELEESVFIDHTASRFDGQFNVQYNILRGPLTPYLQAGLGWTYMDSNIIKNLSVYCGGSIYYNVCRTYANTFDDNAFSYNLGIGLRWDVSDVVFLRGAYMQQKVHSDGDPRPSTARLEIGMMF